MWLLLTPLFLAFHRVAPIAPSSLSFELNLNQFFYLSFLFLVFSSICSLFAFTSFSVSLFLFLCWMSLVGKKNSGGKSTLQEMRSSRVGWCSPCWKKRTRGGASVGTGVHSYVFVPCLEAERAMSGCCL